MAAFEWDCARIPLMVLSHLDQSCCKLLGLKERGNPGLERDGGGDYFFRTEIWLQVKFTLRVIVGQAERLIQVGQGLFMGT